MPHNDSTHPTDLSRRSFLATTAALPFAGLVGCAAAKSGDAALASAASHAPGDASDPCLRFAHLTDSHLQPERGGARGTAACLEHVQSLARKPDFIMTGGDNVMDVFEAKQGRATELAQAFRSTWKQHCSLPVEHTLGNHDIFGWNKPKSGTSGSEADWGKKFACDLYGFSRSYRSFDRAGWRFIVLDSVQSKGDGYVAFIDAEQLAWLEQTLKDTPATMPICVVSHIPILCVSAMVFGNPRSLEKRGQDTIVQAGEMHTDGDHLHHLFKRHGGVKLCLSGHIHLLDRCQIDGITYICDGAVSGNWWKGPIQGTPEGYGVIDLWTDGRFEHRYQPYGWKAEA